MDSATREHVRIRAANLCEYCLLPQENCSLTHHVEHVVARQHGGTDDISKLALACHRCKLRKGPTLTGVDPVTAEIVRLYNPRQDRWTEHFQSVDAMIVGITAIGRTTIHVLSINDARRVELRSLLRRR
jgi:hypothetical protein